MKKFIEVALVLAILLFTGSEALPQEGGGPNNPPPAGAIKDLNGTPVPGGGNGTYQEYSVDFIANIENTAITFAFREDPAFISFANASVTDNAVVEGPNLLQNGDFSGGTYTNNGNSQTPNHWTFANQYGAGAFGVVRTGPGCYVYANCWYDGSVGSFDAISQTIPTIVGHTYHISFFVADNSDCLCNFSDLRSNGVSGIDVAVYAQAGLPSAVMSQTVNVQFNPSPTPTTQVAVAGNPADPAAHSLALTLASVKNALSVSVQFFYEPTDVSTGTNGAGVADGVCEAGATETQDFDCRLAQSFTYQLLPNGDKVVPHIIPSHNFMGVWVRVIATVIATQLPAVAGTDYNGPVDWYYAWNTNPTLAPGGFLNPGAPGAVNPEYATGWNNLNPQLYDRPGENPDIAFVKNITTYSKNCAPTCVGTADPGLGGRTLTLNDIVATAPPNPPAGTALTIEKMVVPVPGISPFGYSSKLPILVSFKLQDETGISNPNALTPPHRVTVATLESVSGKNIPLQFVPGLPAVVTYNPNAKTYYIFLSPAAYKTDGTVYTLQINSDLLPSQCPAALWSSPSNYRYWDERAGSGVRDPALFFSNQAVELHQTS